MYYIDNKNNTDAWMNLALEEYTVRNLDSNHDYLLLYVNKPSLIIGKHQNAVEEINLKTVGEMNIPVIRRISGGGTVYHDMGNLNFSIITKHTLKNFNKYLNILKPVLEVLKKLSTNPQINERNNIIIDKRKISGNAQFTSKHRLLSHGTLLIDSNINMIYQLIKAENVRTYHSKSTKSIRSIVTNVNDHLENPICVEEFKRLLLDCIYAGNILNATISEDDWSDVQKIAETKYKSWEWNYGLSPVCEIDKKFYSKTGEINLNMIVDKGRIQTFKLQNLNQNEEQLKRIQRYFIDQPLDFTSIKAVSKKIKRDKSLSELNDLPWLEIILN